MGAPERLGQLKDAPPAHNPTCLVLWIVWCEVFAWMAVIYLFSSQPDSAAITGKYLGLLNYALRKSAHVGEYVILFCLLQQAMVKTWGLGTYTKTQGRLPKQILSGLTVLVLAVLFAVSDEWHQAHVVGRSASVADVMVDSLGACLGWLICLAAGRLKSRL